MPIYFVLETVTREGMMTVDEAPARAARVVEVGDAYGAHVVEWFFTTGSADFVMKIEAPDDDTMAVFTMALRRSGNVTVKVLRAYTPETWRGFVERLT